MTLRRKQRRCSEEARFRAPTIVSITRRGIEEAQCIRVTHPSALYITDDYIVTHNTALATNMALAAAMAYRQELVDGVATTANGAVVGFFSLEMADDQVMTRILAEKAGISSHRVRQRQMRSTDFDALLSWADRLSTLGSSLHFDDTPMLSIATLRTRARRLKRQKGLGLIVVDYLQLLQGTSTGARFNRIEEISEITRGLKALAKELDVPVLALSQLSRAVEQRDDKRPQLSDLRESGSIEQDADVVMFVYREEYYLSRMEPVRRTDEADDKFNTRHETWRQAMERSAGKAEVIVAKHRHGPTGTVGLQFDSALTKFSDVAEERYSAEELPL